MSSKEEKRRNSSAQTIYFGSSSIDGINDCEPWCSGLDEHLFFVSGSTEEKSYGSCRNANPDSHG